MLTAAVRSTSVVAARACMRARPATMPAVFAPPGPGRGVDRRRRGASIITRHQDMDFDERQRKRLRHAPGAAAAAFSRSRPSCRRAPCAPTLAKGA